MKFSIFINLFFKCQLFYMHIVTLFSKYFFIVTVLVFGSIKTFFPWFGCCANFNKLMSTRAWVTRT